MTLLRPGPDSLVNTVVVTPNSGVEVDAAGLGVLAGIVAFGVCRSAAAVATGQSCAARDN